MPKTLRHLHRMDSGPSKLVSLGIRGPKIRLLIDVIIKHPLTENLVISHQRQHQPRFYNVWLGQMGPIAASKDYKQQCMKESW